MEKDQIFEELKNLISSRFELKKKLLRPESYLTTDLFLDSLDIYELIYDIQEAFAVEISDSIIPGFETLSNLYDYIKKHTAVHSPLSLSIQL